MIHLFLTDFLFLPLSMLIHHIRSTSICLKDYELILIDAINTYVVGSSRKITGGLFTSSSAIVSLFLSPPESLSVIVSRVLVNLSILRISSI